MAVDIIARGMAATADANAETARSIIAANYDPTSTYNQNDIAYFDGKREPFVRWECIFTTVSTASNTYIHYELDWYMMNGDEIYKTGRLHLANETVNPLTESTPNVVFVEEEEEIGRSSGGIGSNVIADTGSSMRGYIVYNDKKYYTPTFNYTTEYVAENEPVTYEFYSYLNEEAPAGLYICTGTDVTGAFDPTKWTRIVISDELTELINKVAQIENPWMVKGVVATVGDLPATAEPGWVYFVGQSGDTDYDEYVYTEDDGWQHIGSANIIVDSFISEYSANPVENRVIASALDEKLKAIAAAKKYDPTKTYANGEYVTIHGQLYRRADNGSWVEFGDNLLATNSSRLKNPTYGYRDNAYIAANGGLGSSANMFITGSIPIKQNTPYNIHVVGWQTSPWEAWVSYTNSSGRLYADGGISYYRYNNNEANVQVTTGSSYDYIIMSIPKDEALMSKFTVYEKTSQKFVKTTITDELVAMGATKADLAIIAEAYDSSTTYTDGDYYTNNGTLYKVVSGLGVATDVADELKDKIDISNLVTVTSTGDMYIGNVCVRKHLTQAEYDLLDPPDERCDYKIVEATT